MGGPNVGMTLRYEILKNVIKKWFLFYTKYVFWITDSVKEVAGKQDRVVKNVGERNKDMTVVVEVHFLLRWLLLRGKFFDQNEFESFIRIV